MQPDLHTIDALKNELQSLLPMKPEYQQKLDKKFRLEFNYNSNHIEGNTLTYGETELLLVFGQTKGDHDKREYDEMEAHDVAYELIKEWAADKGRPLTEKDIKNLNETILVKPFWKDAITPDGQNTRRLIKVGDYKEYPNSVRLQNGEIFHYASPTDTPIQMGELIEWYRTEEEKKELHPVALAALLHYRFVRIHPFDDGNGRISRLLMNYVLLRNNYPPVIIKSDDKKNYLNALHQADAGYLEEFINYAAVQLDWSLDISIKAAKGESIDELGDFNKKINLLRQKINLKEEVKKERSNETISYVFAHSLKPFLEKATNVLNEFDNLFKSKNYEIILYDQNNMVIEYLQNVESIEKYIQIRRLGSILYKYKLDLLRKIQDIEFSLDVQIDITFYELVYDIKSEIINLNMDKLYHEVISEDECQTITENLGNILYNKIEEALNIS